MGPRGAKGEPLRHRKQILGLGQFCLGSLIKQIIIKLQHPSYLWTYSGTSFSLCVKYIQYQVHVRDGGGQWYTHSSPFCPWPLRGWLNRLRSYYLRGILAILGNK